MAQTHAAVAWSVDLSRQFEISQVTREACFPSAYHELPLTGQTRLSLSVFCFSTNTFTSCLSPSLSLSHSSLPSVLTYFSTDLFMQALCMLQSQKGGQRGSRIHRTVLLFPLLLFGEHYLLPHLSANTAAAIAMVFITSQNRLRHWLQK